MDMKWLGILAIAALWIFLLYEAYAVQQRKIQAILSNQRAIANIAKEIMAGKTQKEVLAFIKKNYKISGMAGMTVYSQIKMVLGQKIKQGS